ncbi:MAG: helix-turn-helix domain-containing protein [Candidatus Ratteibacteria bacterium]|nr:helix-turn-helix domain-containing protein [Candidatus Ratteibacteria bacterium]
MVESIGGLLLKARKKKKISLEKAARETKIKKEFLTALEKERFDELPGEIYTRAFLTAYGQYLGIKLEKISELYKKIRPASLEKRSFRLPRPNLSSRHYRKIWIGILIILLIAAAFAYRRRRIKKDLPVSSKTEILPGKKSISGVNLKIKATGDCRLRLKEGDKIIFEGGLSKGEEKFWKTNKEFVLRFDNAANLELWVNDNFIGSVGGEGKFIEALVITPDVIYFDE